MDWAARGHAQYPPVCRSRCGGGEVLLRANASGISHTPAVRSALLAICCSGYALAVDHIPAYATAHTDLRYRAVGLIRRRNWHCLCSGSERQCKESRRYCLEHSFLPFFQNSFLWSVRIAVPGLAQKGSCYQQYGSLDELPMNGVRALQGLPWRG
jgi:hypothetical protein